MVRAAIASGALEPGQAVLEVTSGNTGIGLAIVCRALGHPFYAVMSRGNSPERAQMMRAMGSEVILVDQDPASTPGRVSGPYMKLFRDRAAMLVKELGAYYCDQFENPAHRQAHIDTTGQRCAKVITAESAMRRVASRHPRAVPRCSSPTEPGCCLRPVPAEKCCRQRLNRYAIWTQYGFGSFESHLFALTFSLVTRASL